MQQSMLIVKWRIRAGSLERRLIVEEFYHLNDITSEVKLLLQSLAQDLQTQSCGCGSCSSMNELSPNTHAPISQEHC